MPQERNQQNERKDQNLGQKQDQGRQGQGDLKQGGHKQGEQGQAGRGQEAPARMNTKQGQEDQAEGRGANQSGNKTGNQNR